MTYVEWRRRTPGKTLKICAADVFVVKAGEQTHCATMRSTVMCLAGKSDRRKRRP